MRRKIPSTGALLAFASAARHQSFTRAALELSQTQSAVAVYVVPTDEELMIARHTVSLLPAAVGA